MKRLISVIVALTLALSFMLASAGVASASDCVYEGLTPGFWKNHTDVWVGASPEQTLESLFDIPDVLGLDDYTLFEALKFGGGPGNIGAAKILLRAAVAAYLNASDPDIAYAYGAATVRTMTNNALASLDRATMLALADTFDVNNNLGTN